MAYAPLDPGVFADDAQSSWINLGLWLRGADMAYAAACSELAAAVGSAARLQAADEVVVDVGCGCGDSLELWRREFACEGRIHGVNLTQAECEAARTRTAEDAATEIHCEDAVRFADRAAAVAAADVVLSVDALYHVHTRRDFFAALTRRMKPGARFAAVDILGSRTLAVESPQGTLQRLQLLWKAPRHVLTLLFVATCAGVPLANLLYSRAALTSEIPELQSRVKDVDAVDISDHVFRPFSSHMRRKGFLALRQGQIVRAVSLLASSAFMGWLGWTGAVEMVLYRWDVALEPHTRMA